MKCSAEEAALTFDLLQEGVLVQPNGLKILKYLQRPFAKLARTRLDGRTIVRSMKCYCKRRYLVSGMGMPSRSPPLVICEPSLPSLCDRRCLIFKEGRLKDLQPFKASVSGDFGVLGEKL